MVEKPMAHGLLEPPSHKVVALSFCAFAYWWVVLFGVHLLTCVYNACFAKFYWGFDSTLLSYVFETYRYNSAIPREKFRSIALVYMILAGIHGACALHMLVSLCWHRPSCCVGTRRSKKSSNNLIKEGIQSTVKQTCCARVFGWVYRGFQRWRQLFGVNGSYFHTSIICREVLETVLQTMQAFRMSVHLPDARLNGFYVGLLVINCWSSLVIHSRWFSRDEARRRFALLASDCALDLTSTVGVSTAIVLRYVGELELNADGFQFDILGDDDRLAQMLTETQLVLEASWTDLAMRSIFSLSLAMTITNIKELIRYSPASKIQVQTVRTCSDTEVDGLRATSLSSREPQRMSKVLTKPESGPKALFGPNFHHTVHIGFAVWGAVLLALHVHAATKTPLSMCMPKVHPLAGTLPSCFLVNFNCHSLRIAATNDEVHREWSKFDRTTVVKLRVLHCPAFEMPERFREFSQLQEIQVYNTTISHWGLEAAVTNSSHPKVLALTAARVNMTTGLLPLGLQSPDFPNSLSQIVFCETNLRELPRDIDTKWRAHSSIYVENSKLTSVPPSLVRLQPYYLALSGNSITEVPPELFEVNGLLRIGLARTNISVLPQHVLHPSMSAPVVDLTQTSVSFFWAWMDLTLQPNSGYPPKLLASGSPYCSDLEKIMSGVSTTFSEPFPAGSSPLLMNSTEANWAFLCQVIDCTPPSRPTDFPLDDWDQSYRLINE